jgi:hypothetical protein
MTHTCSLFIYLFIKYTDKLKLLNGLGDEYFGYKSQDSSRGDRWSRGQCAQRAIAEAKHRSQWPVIGWVTKIYYLELLRGSEGTLSRWSRLHSQSLAPTPSFKRG